MANEKRLIDANAFMKDILTAGIGKTIIEYSESDIGYMIRKRPTVDAVEVLRCRDCKFGDWDSEPNDAMVCMRTKDGFWRSGNDFCSFGKRKDGAD